MFSKAIVLLFFAFVGVVLTYFVMALFNVPALLNSYNSSSVSVYFLSVAFLDFLALGYGAMQIIKETKSTT